MSPICHKKATFFWNDKRREKWRRRRRLGGEDGLGDDVGPPPEPAADEMVQKDLPVLDRRRRGDPVQRTVVAAGQRRRPPVVGALEHPAGGRAGDDQLGRGEQREAVSEKQGAAGDLHDVDLLRRRVNPEQAAPEGVDDEEVPVGVEDDPVEADDVGQPALAGGEQRAPYGRQELAAGADFPYPAPLGVGDERVAVPVNGHVVRQGRPVTCKKKGADYSVCFPLPSRVSKKRASGGRTSAAAELGEEEPPAGGEVVGPESGVAAAEEIGVDDEEPPAGPVQGDPHGAVSRGGRVLEERPLLQDTGGPAAIWEDDLGDAAVQEGGDKESAAFIVPLGALPDPAEAAVFDGLAGELRALQRHQQREGHGGEDEEHGQ